MNKNEIDTTGSGNLKAKLPDFHVTAYDEGVAVGVAETVNNNVFVMSDGKQSTLSTRYFNLLIGYAPYEVDYAFVDHDRVLCEYIQPEVKEEFSGWSPETIKRIGDMPAIISPEKWHADRQSAAYARITSIKLQENGVKVYFEKYFPIPFSFLEEHLEDLALNKFELYRTHWTIKQVDLNELLRETGCFPEALK